MYCVYYLLSIAPCGMQWRGVSLPCWWHMYPWALALRWRQRLRGQQWREQLSRHQKDVRPPSQVHLQKLRSVQVLVRRETQWPFTSAVLQIISFDTLHSKETFCTLWAPHALYRMKKTSGQRLKLRMNKMYLFMYLYIFVSIYWLWTLACIPKYFVRHRVQRKLVAVRLFDIPLLDCCLKNKHQWTAW